MEARDVHWLVLVLGAKPRPLDAPFGVRGWIHIAMAGGLALAGCGGSDGSDGLSGGTDVCGPDQECAVGTGGGDSGVPGTGGQVATGGGTGLGGATGTGGNPGTGGAPVQEPEPEPVCDVDDPDEYELDLDIGPGGSDPETSGHFAIFGATGVEDTLNFLEAAHQCFVRDWCWRSAGLSRHSDDGPHYKTNIYVNQIDAGGFMGYDHGAGLAYLEVHPNSINSSFVVVHEFGHALTLTEDGWVDQANTGLWWEAIANFVAESFRNSPYCEDARNDHGIASGGSIINLNTVISNSHLTICNNSNHYEGWPFFTYLTNNPDNYPGLGKMIVPELFRNHLGNNETPLHVLERLAAPTTVQTLLGRYWARMAYLDIESPEAQDEFFDDRNSLNFDNLTSVGGDTYEVLENRRPRYGGANIIPLTVTGDGNVSIEVTNLGNGLDDSNFTATLSVLSDDGTVRYVDLPSGSGQATVASDEEASLVVVNTPDNLYMYNPSDFGAAPTSDPANTGLDYSVVITGATPAP